MGVAIGRLDLKNTITNFQHRYVECASAQIVDSNFFIALLVETISERGSGRLIDDAKDFQPRYLTGILGGLALSIIEISRHRNDGLGNRFSQSALGICFELRKNHSRDLRWAELLGFSVDFDFDGNVPVGRFGNGVGNTLELLGNLVKFSPHESLHRINRVLGVGDSLPLGGISNQAFP